MKKTTLILLILSFAITMSFGATKASTIYYANKTQLENMCRQRGLETGSENEMRERLYSYENLTSYTDKTNSGSEYKVEIISANRLSMENGTAVLAGNAVISFSSDGTGEKTISATEIIIDSENRKLTALENVVFSDKNSNASLNDIESDIFTIFWDTGELFISNATTYSKRENGNRDSIDFYTTGESITYSESGGMLYENGYITSNPEHRYSSINASSISILPGEDMFLSNATLSIGRVPILYLPFFFTPGSRILGNPAFGLSSVRGMFVNTTFEILGKNPKVSSASRSSSSSFSALFKSSGNDSNEYPVSSYYKAEDESDLSDAEKWAAQSDSYVSFILDAFSGSDNTSLNEEIRSGGINAAFDSQINLFDGKLQLGFFDGFGISSPVREVKGDNSVRFYGNNSLSFNLWGIRLDASFPIYSDAYVLEDFGNRIIGFSIDPLLGTEPEFPSTYSSQLSRLDRQLDFSYYLPGKYTNKYLSSFSISDLSIEKSYRWQTQFDRNDARYYSSYVIDSFVLPSLSASLSGTLLDWNHDFGSQDSQEEKEPDITEIHILNDPLLKPLYEASKTKSTSKTNRISSSLRYSLSESLRNEDDFSGGEISSSRFTSSTSSRFSFSLSSSDWFRLEDSINPSYSYQKDKSYLEYGSADSYRLTETGTLNMQNQLSLSIPYLGLSYSLTTKLLQTVWKKTALADYRGEDSPGYQETGNTETWLNLGWNDETVSQHRISFSKRFATEWGDFTPSMSYIIYPLDGALEPSLSYSYDKFNMAFSWRFNHNDENNGFDADLVSLSLAYSETYFTHSTSFKYRSNEFERSSFFEPLTLTSSTSIRTKDRKWSFTEYIDYEYLSSRYNIRNYFNSLRSSIVLPYTTLSLNWKTQLDSRQVEFDSFSLSFSMQSKSVQFWRGRIYLAFGLSTSATLNLKTRTNSSFTFSPSFTFSIAEFLDFKFILNSYNNSLDTYFDENGSFSFTSMFDDLWRSLDFVGNGRHHTFFLMRDVTIQMVHYMEDWNLNLEYKAEVTRVDQRTYRLVPTLSVFLSWKTMPEIKVDKKWKEDKNGVWIED